MKKAIYYIILALNLSACVEVHFGHPQPLDAKNETRFPVAWQGTYTDQDNDTLTINAQSYSYGKGDSILSISQGPEKLSDELILRHFTDNTYFISGKNDSLWNVLMITERSKNSIDVSMIVVDEEKPTNIAAMKDITTVKEHFNSSGKLESYSVDPTAKELDAMLKKKVFTKVARFKRIK